MARHLASEVLEQAENWEAFLAERSRALLESEARWQAVLDTIPDCLKILSPEGRLLQINPAGLRFVEADRLEDVLHASVADLVHPDDRPAMQQAHHRVLQGEVQHLRFRITSMKGTPRWVEMTASPLRSAEGQVVAVLSICRDITERVRSEESLQQSMKLLLNAQRIGNMGSWSLDLATNRLDWSEETCRLFGISRNEFTGTFEDFFSRVLPEDRPKLLSILQAADASGGLIEVEYRIRRPDGVIRWMYERGDVEHDASGRPIRRLGMVMDITERKAAEEALRTSEERFRLLSRATHDAVWTLDLRSNRLTWNEGYKALFGYPEDEIPFVKDSLCESRLHPEDAPRVLSSLQAAITQGGDTWVSEYRYLRKDGTYAYVMNRAYILRDETGHAVQVIGGITDLTEKKALEERLLQSQKMEAVGLLAGGVAHDFNNLLTVILGYTEVLLSMTPPDAAPWTMLSDIQKAAQQAASLTRQLLAFGRRQVLMPQVLDLNASIRGIETMLRRLVGEDIVLSLQLTPHLEPVKVDPGQLEQILINLTMNARDAMREGGQLTIETGAVGLPADNPQGVPAGRYVWLSLTDTGCGIPAEIQHRIFEPFFTTKDPARGTGLGLPTVYGIVRQSGGWIDVSSKVGRGTRFTLFFPAVLNEESLPRDLSKTPLRGGQETILLVEDEEQVRQIARLTLEAQGYHVLTAQNGQEALKMLESRAFPLQLVITDVVMPEMNGRQLVQHLRRNYPHLKVLFISGYADDKTGWLSETTTSETFLQKPFLPLSLARKVREVLDGQPIT